MLHSSLFHSLDMIMDWVILHNKIPNVSFQENRKKMWKQLSSNSGLLTQQEIEVYSCNNIHNIGRELKHPLANIITLATKCIIH
jgi:hypothetical protein